jgi:glutamate racemase
MKTPAFTHSASDLLPSMLSPFDGRGSIVGVFDSGLGGLSVMQAIRQQLPQADILYVADSGHAPYGERDDAFIHDRSSAIVKFLRQQGAQVIVVACNTATAAAIAGLRQHWGNLPIIGVEPGVKPAVARSVNKRIGVLATPATLKSQKFCALMDNHSAGAQLLLQPCPGLAKEIERGELDSAALRALVNTFCEPLKAADVDTAVLGCTHYPLIRPLFQSALGAQVALVDTADAVALQTARLAERSRTIASPQSNDTRPISTGQVSLFTSGSPPDLSRMAHCWLGLNLPAQVLPTAT